MTATRSESWTQMYSSGMNITPAMAPLSPGLSGSPPVSSLSPKKTTFQSLGYLSSGMFSPSLDKGFSNQGKQAPSTLSSPAPSIMSSPKLWQKASISRLAEEFFWIGGSVVAQPKWRLGQFVERCMCSMQNGTQMTKLKGKKNGLVRFFYLDDHKSCIRWRPSKKHDKAKITIDSIHEVCEGKKSEIFRRYADNRFDPNCCFSIYYGERVKSLDLVSTNAEEARTWITGLKYLMAGISDEDSLARRQRTRDQWLQQTFSEADKNGDGTLSIGEVHQLLHKLNVNLAKQKVRQMFQEADTDEIQGSLGFEEFCSFYKMISTRRDLYLIMISYSNQKEVLDLQDLARFLENEQKMRGLSREHLVDIVAKFEPCPENLQRMVIGIDGFTNYMRSPAGDIFNPEHNQVNQDMTQPLCNYFIATSHNTYLTGDQLLSQSRVEMYAYVLQAGCRCVEVDCWDGPDGEPIIHHGYTLTSKILFKDVIETINKYAFTKSQYPVILSIENHCSVPQQKKMAEYLKEVLQDKLDLSSVNAHECKKLPSPEILKGKILVKGKKLPANLDPEVEEGDVSDEDSGDEGEDEDDDQNSQDENSVTSANQPKKKKRFGRSIIRSFKRKRKKRIQVRNKAMSDGESDFSSSRERTQIVYHPKRRKTMRLSRALSDLVKYTKSVRVHDIETQAFANSWQVSSLDETVMNQILQLQPRELVRFNQRQLIRVYPSNYRVDSSNFNPQAYWNAGCHMVAMNYQTEGRMLELNQAKFSSNGNCGYILKPKCMCKDAINPMMEDPLPGHGKTQLVLKIISGQQLPKPKDSVFGDRGEIIDPFVEVEIIGLPVDCSKQQTRVVNDNGFNPMWEETLVFNIRMPQISLVRFQVWDHDHIGQDFIGQRTVAFTSMMPGYRHVYLEGMAESSIFVHVAIHDIPEKIKPTNAVQAARKHIQKAAQKHMKSHQRQSSLDFSVQSSEEGRAPYFRKDLDTISQDSRNGEMSPLIQGLVAKAGIHKGAMSEPLRRANRVKIHEPPETRRGIFSRMSSTDSHHMGAAPYVTADSFDLETSSQALCPDGPVPENQNAIQEELEYDFNEQPESNSVEQETAESEQPEPSEELPPEPQKETFTEPERPGEAQSQPDPLPHSPPVLQPEAKSHPLIPPLSPARVRRTLLAPAIPRPSTPMRTKTRSRSCPRKQTTSPQSPMVNCKPAFHWQTQGAQNYGSYSNQVRPILNGLCLSDSTSSSSDSSTDSLEFVPSCLPAGAEQCEGTLQREMKVLFDQKMREIRCKSPLFLDGESWMKCDFQSEPKINTEVK
ncbi:1-phosphatidylinositol 4,5-bisphosphate phosphodiesterase eta-2 [Mastacembelus armatus]|uniref:1-phosphatidylinositol 4,5-bisphosphate phosphodiesterase eta-2 n=1 Tax=Mastacembelus armatus TaxID=205130 RepID=UPI000E461F46|nr:1-phosphatidylinositol 4,5-bisphosphate phosphodiesterase eta-2-like [Mastacembelus armatus]